MSEPSWRAMSRSEPSSSCSSWRPQAEHRRHLPDAHPHAWVIQRHRDPAGRRKPSAEGDLAVVWVQGSWVSGPAQSEPTKVDVRGMIVWGKKPDGTWRVAMEHIGGEAGRVADHGLSIWPADSPTELAQPRVTDPEVMTHLVNDRPPNLLDDLGIAVAHSADGMPIDRDPVRQDAGVERRPTRQRHPLVEPQQARWPTVVLHRDGHVAHQFAQLSGYAVKGLAHHPLESLGIDVDHGASVLPTPQRLRRYPRGVGVDAGSTDGRTGFGDLLRRHRRRVGLSQEALAEIAGLSRRGIADLERGARRFPYPDTVRRLADALGLDPGDRELFVHACRPSPRAKRRHVLPIEPTPMVGRDRELAHVIRLAEGSRLLTLTGTGGIGKTRLATGLAHRTESQFADGAVIIDVTLVGDVPDAFHTAVARGLGVLCPPGDSLADSVLRYLESKHLLLVLDNCEHVAEGCAELASVLLRACVGVNLVVTSREPLRIPGETVWVVPPMAADESVILFVQRARAAGAADMRTARDLELVAEIAHRLEGVPLAIELTVARVPSLGLPHVALQLSDRLGFLSHGGRLGAPRHQTLRAAFDWSWELLTPTEQLLFARLAVFAGGWTVEAAQEVCAGTGLSATDVVDGLAGLVEKSLVLTADHDEQRRFRLLDTLREYARERLAGFGNEEEVAARHAQYFRQVADDGAATRLGLHYPADAAMLHREIGRAHV